MSARQDAASDAASHHSRSSSASSGVHPNVHSGRYSPSTSMGPDMAHSGNPLHQLLHPQAQHGYGPPPPPMPNQPPPPSAQQFMQQFMNNHASGPMRSMPYNPPLPPMPHPVMHPAYQQQPRPANGIHSASSSPQANSFASANPAPPSASTLSQPGTASSSSLAATNGPTERPGTPISGEDVEYMPQHDDGEEASQALEVTPITLYNSERASQHGNLLAVNDKFISYPIRNGLIRVISQNAVDRLLLRHHEHQSVTELAFFPGRSDLLLSASTGNRIAVWEIRSEPTVSRELRKTIRSSAQRVKWHPTDPNRIAIVDGSVVYILNLSAVGAEEEEDDDLSEISVVCADPSSSAFINDVAFSPDGAYLIAANADGVVHVYGGIEDQAEGERAEIMHSFEPFDGEEVNSVLFYKQNLSNAPLGLLVAGDDNRKLSLWSSPLDDTTTPLCSQTVTINDNHVESAPLDIVLDPTQQFLLLADRTKPRLYVLHLASDNAGRSFDNIVEFVLAYPVLSMAAICHDENSPPNTRMSSQDLAGLSIQLYCVQTQAIQRYNVYASNCYVPPLPAQPAADDSSHAGNSFGQTVGATTNEGERSYQTPAESPEAHVSDVDASEPLLPTESVTSEDTPMLASRSYTRSSPSSSVRAMQDDSSLPYEPSLDGIDSEGQQALLSYLRRMEAAQTQRDEQLKEQMRQFGQGLNAQVSSLVATQVEKTIQRQLQSVLVPAMGRIVLHTMEHNFMKPVQTGFQQVIAEKLLPDMETKLKDALATSLPEEVSSSMDQVVERMADDVREPVRNAFRECFRQHIIPSFEAATQKMFEQIDRSVASHTANGNTSQSVSGQLQYLIDAVDNLTQRVDEFSEQAEGGNFAAGAGSAREVQFEQQKTKIQTLLDQNEFEEAFKLALGEQDVELVAFACKQTDPRVVLNSRPPKLSQMLVLCLVQQLGADLRNDVSLKLHWLRESLLVMNQRDASIAGFVVSVLQELRTSLGNVPEEARDSQYMLLHHILNSMLSSS